MVQEGDNLWFISRRLYGSGIYFDLLFDANRGIISSPRTIFPGQILAVPIAPSLPR